MTRNKEYLQAAADRSAIHDLLARYCWELDHGSVQVWTDLFTEEGVFEAPRLGLWVSGKEALLAFAQAMQTSLVNVHHLTSSHIINLDGDQATGRCSLNEFAALPDGVYPAVQGWYEDRYVFDGRCWRIAHRQVYLVEPQTAALGKIGQHYAAFFEAGARFLKPK